MERGKGAVLENGDDRAYACPPAIYCSALTSIVMLSEHRNGELLHPPLLYTALHCAVLHSIHYLWLMHSP